METDKQTNLLVVEDEGIVALDIKNRLHALGYNVLGIENSGESAVAFVRKTRPDLILMDIRLHGEMDGIEAANKVKEFCNVPVVFVSAYADKKNLERARVTRAFGFILKPFQDHELQTNIEIALYKHSMEERITESERRLHTLIKNLNGIVYRMKIENNTYSYEFVSNGIESILEYTPDEATRMDNAYSELVFDDDRKAVENQINSAAETGERYQFIYRMRTKTGELKWIWDNGMFVNEPGAKVNYCEGFISDISNRKKVETSLRQIEERAVFLEYYDPLTRLANKELFARKLEAEREKAEKRGQVLAVMMIGIDRFKNINDLHGRSVGDQLLKGIAKKLKNTFREGDLISRYSGDRFLVLLSDLAGPHDVDNIVKKVFDILKESFYVGEFKLRFTSSIGIAIFPNDGRNVEALLKNSESAMYMAKDIHGNSHVLFNKSLNDEIIQKAKMEIKLQDAIKNNEFVMYYQPKIDQHACACGMEALVRWNDSISGTIISPGLFIPIAEQSGQIVDIGYNVLYLTMRQIRTWIDEGYSDFVVSVNLSPYQFKQPELVREIAAILRDTGIKSSFVELEITETGIMEHEKEGIAKIHELKAMGMDFSIDDFGTGYSSLIKLKEYPLSTLKIDRSFISTMFSNPKSMTITKSIISLAHNLSFNVVAEGVETKEEYAFLLRKGCEQFQGYLFSKPVPHNEYRQNFLKTRGPFLT